MVDRERNDPVHTRVKPGQREPSTRLPSETVTTACFDGRRRFDLHLGVSIRAFRRDLRLAVEDVSQTQFVPAPVLPTPDARRAPAAWTPVPVRSITRAWWVKGLSFSVESPVVRLTFRLRNGRAGSRTAAGLFDRGVEEDAQHVAAPLSRGLTVRPSGGTCCPPSDSRFVQEDVGIGVQTEELSRIVFIAASAPGVEGDRRSSLPCRSTAGRVCWSR